MAEHGFTVLRFTNDDVHANVEGVVTAIQQEAERLRALRA
jgi:BirA family biotin operon repressor/biotin-[acetyl-CoA-carboxylase] ligase